MHAATKSTVKILLQVVAWFLFVAAGLTFWVGGRAISEFAKTERILAEMEGTAVAVALAGLGAVAKAAGERIDEAKKMEH